jgi:hypothetical protein
MRPRLVLLLISLGTSTLFLGTGTIGILLYILTQNAQIERGTAPEAAMVEVSLGQAQLRLPRAYVRQTDPSLGGNPERLELEIHFPDFRPVERPQHAASAADDAQTVFISLQAADATLDPADRFAKLYARFLETEAGEAPAGLIMRRFEPGSPYEAEDLYLAPPEGRLFTARCTRPRQPPDGFPETCLAEIRLRGIDARIRFRPARLVNWEQLENGSRDLLLRSLQ